MGAGGPLELKTTNGDRVTKTFAGSTPTITNNTGNTTTIFASNGSTITGLKLSNAGVGVNVSGKNNVALKNLTIDVNYPGATSRGVYVLGNSSDVTITNVNVTAALGSNNTGMTFDTSDNIFMTGGSVKGVASAASGSSHNISNTNFHDIPTGDGIRFQTNDHTISGTGNSSSNLNNVYQKIAGTLTGTIEFSAPVSTVQN